MTSIQDYLDPLRRYLARKDYATDNTSPLPKARPEQALIESYLEKLRSTEIA